MIGENKTQKGTEDNLVNTGDELTRYQLIERYYYKHPIRRTPKNMGYLKEVNQVCNERFVDPNTGSWYPKSIGSGAVIWDSRWEETQ
ncbi:hypothetical protein HYT23_06430 [Candidatus Pacearchaeota archaeon]|nr:hypothetical protein [Candidatus Pacearchaeota archaeon]